MVKKDTRLTLILPNLSPVLTQKINTPILPNYFKKIMAHAVFSAEKSGLSRVLLNYFSETAHVGRDLPLAALTSKTNALHADPCYLHADRDQILLFSDDLTLTNEESLALISEIQPLFDEVGGKLRLTESGQWLLDLNRLATVSFTALDDVKGKSVQGHLPKGDDLEQKKWIRLWNEVQMQLYISPINQQRTNAGKAPINSVWFWGAGTLTLQQKAWTQVQGHSTLLQQLANKTNTPMNASINNEEKYDVNALTSGEYLCLLNEFDLEQDWLATLNDVDNKILKPLWKQCKMLRINTLTLHIPEHGTYRLTGLDCWKFWKL